MTLALGYSNSHRGWGQMPLATGVLLGLAIISAADESHAYGTGADVVHHQFPQHNSLRAYASEKKKVNTDVARSPSDDLVLVRTILKPAVSDLATALSVSRQTVYNWLNGDAVTQENAIRKLRDLALAAEELEQAGVTINAALLKRKFFHGKTLMQVVQAGESVSDAAHLMVHIHQREAAQRERITAQFAHRKNTPATADFDLPEANDLSEDNA